MRTVLVVDDDPGILESLRFLLEDTGYSVVAATDGSILPNITLRQKIDLILLDYWLPKENGGEIAQKLKSKKETKHIPIIIISASYNIKELVMRAGADDFLPKPYDIDELLRKIKKFIN